MVLGVTLNKSEQISNWSHRPLRLAQLIYGGLDALCQVLIVDSLEARLEYLTTQGVYHGPDIHDSASSAQSPSSSGLVHELTHKANKSSNRNSSNRTDSNTKVQVDEKEQVDSSYVNSAVSEVDSTARVPTRQKQGSRHGRSKKGGKDKKIEPKLSQFIINHLDL